jgi:hypothetical protein
MEFRQLGLFGDDFPDGQRKNQYGFPCEDRRPIARESDADTSHLASKKVRPKLVGLRQTFVEVLGTLGQATANEVAAAAVGGGLVVNAESIRKRAQELVDLGFVRVVGSRVCSVTGNAASVYEVVR